MDSNLVSFFVQAGATLVGALVAFELERQRQKRSERRQRVNGLHRALFVFVLQRSFMLNIKQQALEPHRTDPFRTFTVRPSPMTPPAAAIDRDSLAFLLDDREADLLYRVMNADLWFSTLISVVRDRNVVHAQFQQRLEEVQRNLKREFNIDEFKTAVGPLLSKSLEDLTNALYEINDRALKENEEAAALARQYVRRKFPNEHLFTVDDLESHHL